MGILYDELTKSMANINMRIDAFKIIKKLRPGMSADIYIARNMNNNRKVLIKIFNIFQGQSFVHEINAYDSLPNFPFLLQRYHSSQHSILIDENSQESAVSYVALEYIKQRDLLSMVKQRGKLDDRVARNIFVEIVNAADMLASFSGKWNLSISSEHVLITQDFRIKICDLNSIFRSRLQDNLYKPPESMGKTTSNSESALVFRLGAILFHMLVGNSHSRSNSRRDCLYRHFYSGEFERFWGMVSTEVDEDAKRILQDMLAVNPNQRPILRALGVYKWMTKNG